MSDMMVDDRAEPEDEISPLEALLELPRSAREDTLEDFLVTVADTVCRTADFTTVVINLYRPAWDDYEAVLVIGSPESVDALTGTCLPRSEFRRILAEAEQRVPGIFFLAEESGFWDDISDVFTPELVPADNPDAWRAGDGLVAFLSDSTGAPLATFSMDEPASGLRPTDEDLRFIGAICSHAEIALESARANEAAAENARILSLLLEVSPSLASCATGDELLSLAVSTIVPELGFERAGAYVVADDRLVLRASAGWEAAPGLAATLDLSSIEMLIDPVREQAGCFLGAARDLFGDELTAGETRSRRNGRGTTAWNDHCLLVPCRTGDGALRGLVVVEDPLDRLLPSPGRRRAARLLVDQVAAGLESLANREQLNHLASHDPLTGVRNRRGLDDVLGEHGEVALLVCDLDHFKTVNDRYGHELGDAVLARFGELLRDLARDTDVPIRLGGEEFCVVLPRTDAAGAVLAAERLRVETTERLAELVPGGLTVSIGVAATAAGVLDARRLLAAADRGLYAAKAAGRNRSVLVDDDA